MRVVGLALHDPVPDAETIWLYREQLTRAGALDRAFARLDARLRERGCLAMDGQVVDATAKISLANLAYNMRRLVWMGGRLVPA